MVSLIELYGHQAWADAEHWRAILALPAAREDADTKTWMHHLHLCQWAFLAIVRGEPLELTKPEDFATPEALRDYAREYHAKARPCVASLSEAQLSTIVTVPWFKDFPPVVNARQALMQAAMHSQHHRAQNATRLRRLGGEPPTTDFILWVLKGQPDAEW